MNWTDTAIVLGARPFGEGHAIVEVLSRSHGRTVGLLRGRRKNAAALVPGNRVEATWRARLADQLGSLTLEVEVSRAAPALASALETQGVMAVTAIIETTLAERDPHPLLFDALDLVLGHLANRSVWPALLVRFELGLLSELGFALDLGACALTGSRDDLAFVSPRTGRAASRAAGAPFADRLLALPSFLVEGQGVSPPSPRDLADGFALTGHFLETRVFAALGKAVPDARIRLAEAIGRLARPDEKP